MRCDDARFGKMIGDQLKAHEAGGKEGARNHVAPIGGR